MSLSEDEFTLMKVGPRSKDWCLIREGLLETYKSTERGDSHEKTEAEIE